KKYNEYSNNEKNLYNARKRPKNIEYNDSRYNNEPQRPSQKYSSSTRDSLPRRKSNRDGDYHRIRGEKNSKRFYDSPRRLEENEGLQNQESDYSLDESYQGAAVYAENEFSRVDEKYHKESHKSSSRRQMLLNQLRAAEEAIADRKGD
ncbi:MAG: hypothetical protein MHPSP_003002, partial [Paramarteilia canceri]